MANIPRRQPRPKPPPYKRKPKETQSKGPGPSPASSVKSLEKEQCQDLTTYEWLTAFAYIDEHPDETQTDQYLGSRYVAFDQESALKAAEGDAAQASAAVEELASTCQRSGLVRKLTIPKPPQLQVIEQELMDCITILKDRNRIFGTSLSIDEFLDPPEGREDLDTKAEMFEDDAEKIAEVRRREAIRTGDAIEVDSDDEDDCHGVAAMATSELIALTEKLEAGYVSRVGVDSSPDFLHHLRAFRAELRRDQVKNAKQTTTLVSHCALT